MFSRRSCVEHFLAAGPIQRQNFSRDDKGMAKLFSECFDTVLRFNTTQKEWACFDGKIWKPDRGGMMAANAAKVFADSLAIYAFQLADGSEKTDFIRFVNKYGDYSRRKILVEDARSEMFFSNEDLDRDGRLYNCQNGVLNLETGVLLPHKPEYLLSKISNVYYDPAATAPLFNQTLHEVLQDDADKICFLQKAFGLTLTTDTSCEEMYILYGPTTRNGKSTILETVSHMHGGSEGYALSMVPETLAQRKTKDSRQASGDIARLDGCRMLTVSEPPKRMIFDAALLKTLLGRDTITARHLHEREFQFIPVFTLFMNTNYLPVIQDDTLFSSGRIKVIEFSRHFSPEEQDTTLKNRLRSRDELSGTFNFCFEGLKLFREVGIDPPSVVVQAVKSYREASDKIANFLSDRMERTGKNTGAGTVYQAYRTWCIDCGFGIESKQNFFSELKAKGLFSPSGTVNGMTVRNVIIGYELIPDNDPPPPEEPPYYGHF